MELITKEICIKKKNTVKLLMSFYFFFTNYHQIFSLTIEKLKILLFHILFIKNTTKTITFVSS